MSNHFYRIGSAPVRLLLASLRAFHPLDRRFDFRSPRPPGRVPSETRDRSNLERTVRSIALLAMAVGISTTATGQIIPSDRRIDWSPDRVGVPGGIPARTQIYTTLAAGASTSTIQNALNNCPSNQVVLLGPGVFTITSSLNMSRSGITLRGSGSNTILRATSGGQIIHLGWGTAWDSGTTISSGLARGSSNLVLSSSSGFVPGMIAKVDQNNDTSLVWTSDGQARVLSQVVRVEAVSGNTVTVWPPLYHNYGTAFDARLKHLGNRSYQTEFSGIEHLTLEYGTSAPPYGIFAEQLYGCWLLGVTSVRCPNYHIIFLNSTRCTLKSLNILDAAAHTPNHSGIIFGSTPTYTGTCASIIEDCVITRNFPGIELNYGSSGNVVAYNFVWDSFQDGFGQGCSIDANHGPHNMMNLFEGNITSMFQSDGYFGSASHGTIFRSYSSGWGPTYQNNSKTISLNRWSLHWNVVGNVLGTNVSTIYEMTSSGDTRGCVYQLGYPNMGNNAYTGTRPPNPPVNPGNDQSRDLNVGTTILRHGNWDAVNKTVLWDSSIADRNIPASLYLTSKPSWFGALAWPPIDPSNPTYSRSITNLPAGYRYVFGQAPPAQTGSGSPPSNPANLRLQGTSGSQASTP